MESKIKQALFLVDQYPIDLTESIVTQLKYCLDVVRMEKTSENVEKINMGFLANKYNEGSFSDEFCSIISEIDYEMKHTYLDYAAKVRLGIHRR